MPLDCLRKDESLPFTEASLFVMFKTYDATNIYGLKSVIKIGLDKKSPGFG